MNNFIKYLKTFTIFVIVFLLFIVIITIPANLKEHNYVKCALIIAIVLFITFMLFVFNRYFLSMAIKIRSDDDYSYFEYANKVIVKIPHSKVQRIKCTPYRYIFILNNGEKLYLGRITGCLKIESDVSEYLKMYYSDKMIME